MWECHVLISHVPNRQQWTCSDERLAACMGGDRVATSAAWHTLTPPLPSLPRNCPPDVCTNVLLVHQLWKVLRRHHDTRCRHAVDAEMVAGTHRDGSYGFRSSTAPAGGKRQRRGRRHDCWPAWGRHHMGCCCRGRCWRHGHLSRACTHAGAITCGECSSTRWRQVACGGRLWGQDGSRAPGCRTHDSCKRSKHSPRGYWLLDGFDEIPPPCCSH
jgi:hypothetical protein